ncbi:MAG: peptide chain release factor 2 [Chloroflexi bacterium]|nr:peptide chain release factor 2 [Chloroflexota bacterium]
MPEQEGEILKLEQGATSPGFWEEPQGAQRDMQRLARLKDDVESWRELERRATALEELVDLAIAEGDPSLEDAFSNELTELEGQLEDREFRAVFSGEFDERSAILAIHAGAGGTDSQDWAQMLLRMYLRWAERRGYRARILDLSPGEEAGIKSVTLEIGGKYAYGYAKAEKGVHRLIRLSAYDALHQRHTSFALVEALPVAEENVDVVINPEELRVDVYRASGAGGQSVQKTSSAVRIVHIPTGIIVTCQNERSQLQNKEIALKILRARLVQQDLERKAEEQARLKGKHVSAEGGHQIRSYTLHPYRQVKDHRTDYETSDTAAILDGDLDELQKRYLLSAVK